MTSLFPLICNLRKQIHEYATVRVQLSNGHPRRKVISECGRNGMALTWMLPRFYLCSIFSLINNLLLLFHWANCECKAHFSLLSNYLIGVHWSEWDNIYLITCWTDEAKLLVMQWSLHIYSHFFRKYWKLKGMSVMYELLVWSLSLLDATKNRRAPTQSCV